MATLVGNDMVKTPWSLTGYVRMIDPAREFTKIVHALKSKVYCVAISRDDELVASVSVLRLISTIMVSSLRE